MVLKCRAVEYSEDRVVELCSDALYQFHDLVLDLVKEFKNGSYSSLQTVDVSSMC